jgi:hypothetical protein
MLAGAAAAEGKHCTAVGGMLLTNLGAVNQNTTMGPAEGDLKGAVGVTITNMMQNGSTLVIDVQHHWVTDSGDTLSFLPATVTAVEVAPHSPIFAVVTYAAELVGGTGKYKNAKGNLNSIGEVDLATNQVVLRYTGKVCFDEHE